MSKTKDNLVPDHFLPAAKVQAWADWLNKAHEEGLDLTKQDAFVRLHEELHHLAAAALGRNPETYADILKPLDEADLPLQQGDCLNTDDVLFGHEGGFYLTSTHDFSDGDGPCHRPDRQPQVSDLRGSVTIKEARAWPRKETTYTFDKLTPFAQSYTEALLTDLLYFQEDAPLVTFGMFNPSTLQRVIKDCAAAEAVIADHGLPPSGLEFWYNRLNESLPECEHFDPFRTVLTPVLTNGTSRASGTATRRIIFALPLRAATDKPN